MKEFNIFDFAGIDFPFFIGKGVHYKPFLPHTHNFTELEIITSGSADHIVEGKAYNIKKGDVVVLVPPFVHELQNVQELEHYNFKFDLEKLILLETDIEKLSSFQSLFILQPFYRYQHDYVNHMTLDSDSFSKVKILCDLIYEEWTSKRDGYKWVIKSYFLALLTYLARSYSPKVIGGSPKIKDIIDTVSYIQENLSQKITVSNLSSMACLSERQYTRVFKEIYGVSPIIYVINCRLTLACRMMKNTQKSLSEISMSCGFGDKVYFCKLFKNRYGITPGQYRKSL
ncbi:MAG: AraC family transcriptional regulator [Bacillota bacterium]|nr:AraC family transcriptional regulator [Bacillota bacterium]